MGDIVDPVVGNGVDYPVAIRIVVGVIETIPLPLEISAHGINEVGREVGVPILRSQNTRPGKEMKPRFSTVPA